MNVNPITMEAGSQLLERRSTPSASGLSRVMGPSQSRPDGISGSDSSTISRFESTADHLSKGLGGRVVTPEWQQKVGLSRDVQVADQAMEEIDQKLQQAKADLLEIRKMFPPYPQGSEERAELLSSYKSLRLQIDQLTFPPESEMASKILGNSPTVEGGALPEVGQFPVQSGLGGLELLEISGPVEDIKDSELPAVIENLERAAGFLYERRVELEASAKKIFNQGAGQEVEIIKLSSEVREQLATFDFPMGRPQTGVHQDLPSLG